MAKVMRTKIKQYPTNKKSKIENRKSKVGGSVLVLVVVFLVVLIVLGLGMLTVAYGVRHRANILKNEAAAMLAAEAGYEKATFEMGKQLDMLSALQQGTAGTSGSMSLPGGSFDYQIGLFAFVRSRPIYRVVSNGYSGVFHRTVDAYVVQAVSGWDMGQCRVPLGGTSTYPVNFATGEILDVPIHINKLGSDVDPYDDRDIYISGSPRFLQEVAMGESRYKAGGTDKYAGVMGLFEGGICFNQPDSRITDEAAVQMKVDRFRNSTDDGYNFSDDTGKKPVATAGVYISNPHAAVQLEFFVQGGVGKVKMTNNCTALGFRQNDNSKTWDFKITPGTDGKQSQKYDLYAYHYAAYSEPHVTVDLTDTYVTQSFGGIESEPAGQIFIDGDVVIGGDSISYPGMEVKGKITVVATGNIWLADSVKVSDYDGSGTYYPRDSNGMPDMDNPNILGLIAQGVIKVVDPGMSEYSAGGVNGYPGPPQLDPNLIGSFVYTPVGIKDAGSGGQFYHRHLPDPMEVEASMVIGGGGWGAVNVERRSGWTTYGGRKETNPGSSADNWDMLIVRGTIVERCRGVVGLTSSPEGYKKHYYFDERVLLGILPGDIWLQGKYVPAPSGWHDYR
jgi:hypothetical protein